MTKQNETKPAAPVTPVKPNTAPRANRRHRDMDLLRTIGERLRAARELSCFSQSDAAKLLGYQNSSKLSKIEKLMNSKNIPLAVLKKAADVYQVSLDYLFGRTDDWGTTSRQNQNREVSAWLFDEWEKARRRDLASLRKLNDRLSTIDGSVETCVDQAFAMGEALNLFIARNRKQFADMPGGARLVATAERLSAAAKESRANIRRFHMECRSVRQPENSQEDLFGDKDGA